MSSKNLSKNILRIFIDLLLIAISFIMATLIRLEGNFLTSTNHFIWHIQLLKILPFVVLIKMVSLVVFGDYRRFWRYTDIKDIVHLTRSLFVPSIIILIPRFFGASPHDANLWGVSYGVTIIDFLLSLGLLSGVRLLRHFLIEQQNIKKRLLRLQADTKRTLIIGAGEAGLQVVNSLSKHPELGLMPMAVLDDDTQKHGMALTDGVVVKGFVNDVKYWVDELAIDQIIIAIPSINLQERRRINLLCSETNVDVRTVPGVDQLAAGQVSIEQMRKLSMEDLLGREEVNLNVPEVLAYLQDKRVLVTGAGGSIGKELCRQLILKCKIQSLCLLGKGENSIFEAWQELLDIDALLRPKALIKKIADIKDYSRMESVIEEFKPEVIFHAAAHKHVHLMEINACEAFENNVIGTRNLAEIAGLKGVETFVLISTDKAVNPTSIMGASKNLAEKAVLLCSKKYPGTKYTGVRFGNVLGSRGSVIKVWEQQLKNSRPLTVTHRDAIRYFMTIPEAAQLVIQSAAKANNGEIMVLDMGTPIKIYDLAKQFIQLAGFTLDEVPIEIIGLKDGEKLHEELLTASEFVEAKLTDKIFKARINFDIQDASLSSEIDKLAVLAKQNRQEDLKSGLRALVRRLSKDLLKATSTMEYI